MDTTSTPLPGRAGSASPLSAATASPHQRAVGVGLTVANAVSNQSGAAIGALAFPAIGAIGVVAVRQIATAVILTSIVRPRLRGLRREQWLPILGLALAFGVMNLCLYAAVERIGLGLAVTLEFLGPLAVALLGSRRPVDLGCAVLAGVGVIVLTAPGPTSDVLGIVLGLTAASAWAAYILLNRILGQRLPGLHGTAAASLVSGVVWLPLATIWFSAHPPQLSAIGLAVVCAVFASVIPYVGDLLALRRLPAPMFSTLTSINPVIAALAGWIVLGQVLQPNEWAGIGIVVVSNVAVSLRGLATAREQRRAIPIRDITS